MCIIYCGPPFPSMTRPRSHSCSRVLQTRRFATLRILYSHTRIMRLNNNCNIKWTRKTIALQRELLQTVNWVYTWQDLSKVYRVRQAQTMGSVSVAIKTIDPMYDQLSIITYYYYTVRKWIIIQYKIILLCYNPIQRFLDLSYSVSEKRYFFSKWISR